METQTDSSLMKLVQAGDNAQLATLFERYHAAIFRYILQLSKSRVLSEDLTQEVFFRVLKFARTYDTDLAFSTWLYRLARNAYIDSLRRRAPEVAGADTFDVRSPEPMPEELFARKQDEMFLREALEKLPEDRREILILSRFHGLPYSEIAKILRCEAGAVKARAYRALKELRATFCELRGEKIYDA